MSHRPPRKFQRTDSETFQPSTRPSKVLQVPKNLRELLSSDSVSSRTRARSRESQLVSTRDPEVVARQLRQPRSLVSRTLGRLSSLWSSKAVNPSAPPPAAKLS